MMNVQFLQVRRAKGLTQDQLAFQADCNQSEISLIEAQAWIPPPELQERLAGVLETTIEVLFGAMAARAS